mgnify:CR=1 FL=1
MLTISQLFNNEQQKKGKTKMININELTISDIKTIQSLFSSKQENSPYKIGQAYLIRTVTHHYTGIIKSVGDKELVLSSAAWIADDGRYFDALRDGTLNEIEPIIGDAIIGRGSIIDAVEWKHACPTEQK